MSGRGGGEERTETWLRSCDLDIPPMDQVCRSGITYLSLFLLFASDIGTDLPGIVHRDGIVPLSGALGCTRLVPIRSALAGSEGVWVRAT